MSLWIVDTRDRKRAYSTLDSFELLFTYSSFRPEYRERRIHHSLVSRLKCAFDLKIEVTQIIIATIASFFKYLRDSLGTQFEFLSNRNRDSGKGRPESGIERNILSARRIYMYVCIYDTSYLLSPPILFPLCYTVVVKRVPRNTGTMRTNDKRRGR